MDVEPAFIAVDWGTSNARYMRADRLGQIIDQREGLGVAKLGDATAIEEHCFDVIGDWIAQSRQAPVLMAGMVGSTIGWHEVDYVATPAGLPNLTMGVLRFSRRGTDFLIVPGLSTIRKDGLPDAMRGEEIQVFGAFPPGGGLICLPGTHSKWVETDGSKILSFHTALTGELIELLGKHSVLLSEKGAVQALPNDDFIAGVKAAKTASVGLESLLFTTRSHVTTSSNHITDPASFLTGLVIGSDIKSAFQQYGKLSNHVDVIGSFKLTELYSKALSIFEVAAVKHDAQTASTKGLTQIYEQLPGLAR